MDKNQLAAQLLARALERAKETGKWRWESGPIRPSNTPHGGSPQRRGLSSYRASSGVTGTVRGQPVYSTSTGTYPSAPVSAGGVFGFREVAPTPATPAMEQGLVGPDYYIHPYTIRPHHAGFVGGISGIDPFPVETYDPGTFPMSFPHHAGFLRASPNLIRALQAQMPGASINASAGGYSIGASGSGASSPSQK